jgi:hypothetical protein
MTADLLAPLQEHQRTPRWARLHSPAAVGHSWDAGRRVLSVSDEPSNAASEALRLNFSALNGLESAPRNVRAFLTDDFVHEDRRRVVSFPNVDADSHQKFVETAWQTGAGQPEFVVSEILAVRGDRFVAALVRIDYGNGMLLEAVHVFALDATLSLVQREVDFDIDDVEGAIAELDRLYSQADAT